MSEKVLDASVLLALIREEPSGEGMIGLLDGAVMSAVNSLEVWTKVYEQNLSKDPRMKLLFALLNRIEPFTREQARLAAQLRPRTRHVWLSLAVRACLAVAIELRAEVYTADRAWAQVDVGCRVHLMR